MEQEDVCVQVLKFSHLRQFYKLILATNIVYKNFNKSKTHNFAKILKMTIFFKNMCTLITEEIFTKRHFSSSWRFLEQVGIIKLFWIIINNKIINNNKGDDAKIEEEQFINNFHQQVIDYLSEFLNSAPWENVSCHAKWLLFINSKLW